NHFPTGRCIETAGGWQCRVGWPFINGLPAPCLCVLPGSAQNRDPVPTVSCTRSRSCDH
ncbi:unnamed protein product, partial [Staurois parvus]